MCVGRNQYNRIGTGGLPGGVPPETIYIFVWNSRGIGDPVTLRELRGLVQEYTLSMLCIVATKIAKYRVDF